MKICAVMIYFRGNVELIIENIRTYIDYIDQLIIWMNSPLDKKNEILKAFSNKNIFFRGDGTNIGISKALNIVLLSIDNSYDYLLTMDQDSKWLNIGSYIETVNANSEFKKSIFAYGPKVTVSIETVHQYVSEIIEVDSIITSGSLVDIRHLKAIGGYCEELWIDGIDEELCYRAKEKGLKIQRIQSATLLQQYGSGKKIKIGKHEIINPEYNESRKYNIVKNHIYLIKRFNLKGKTKRDIIIEYILLPLFFTLAFETEKKKKCRAIYKGIIDGLKWKVK